MLQVAKSLFQAVFRCYGLLEDILPDHGPHFIARIWKAFFRKLGATVRLTSGDHPVSNGQAEWTI